MPHDVIIVGLGAMGAAAAHELAARGARVLGLDRFAPPHTLGSTHGKTRIIREAYFEHPLYVPLVRRAYERWAALEAEAGDGRTLLIQTGGIMVGPPEGTLVAGARRSATEHGIPCEEMPVEELRRRWPVFRGEDGMLALHESRAGLLLPERIVETYHALAKRAGAELRYGEALLRWRADGAGVSVETASGTYRAGSLILAAGAWMPELLMPPHAGTRLELPLTIERQVFHWFAPASDAGAFVPERCPIVLWEYAHDSIYATYPDMGDGVKAQIHHDGELTDPSHVRRETMPDDEMRSRAILARFLPAANGRVLETAVCLYTNTPDRHFIIDTHPAHAQVVLASPCSGHGFKFASAIGEVLADLALGRGVGFDLRAFRVARFGSRDGG
ncbi:MAG: N-methyl-L-tryptophan oxidase [Gemmatimonadota bacterium]|nr:N-methyl-L-tryptophan oxidase [Gemmatimonadota bacterium]